MPYVSSLVLLVLGLILLVLLLFKSLRVFSRFRAVQKQVATDIIDRSGLVKARMAGVRVALDERRRRAID